MVGCAENVRRVVAVELSRTTLSDQTVRGAETGAGDFLDGAGRANGGGGLLEVWRQPQCLGIVTGTAPERAVVIGGDVRRGAGQRHRLELSLAQLVDSVAAVPRPDLMQPADGDLTEVGRVLGNRREGGAVPLRQLLLIAAADREYAAVFAGGDGDGIAGLLRPGGAVEIDDAAVDRGAPQAAGATAGRVLQQSGAR